MPESKDSAPIFYHSIYRHGVDDKRRLAIPAKWRSEGELTFSLMLWKKAGQPPCLLVLPPGRMTALAQKVADMPFSDPKAEALRRLLGAESELVTVDAAGRICLPQPLADAAGIEKEAVLVGMLDRFQIWNPKAHKIANKVDEGLREEAYKLI
jgi:MraZ protein